MSEELSKFETWEAHLIMLYSLSINEVRFPFPCWVVWIDRAALLPAMPRPVGVGE